MDLKELTPYTLGDRFTVSTDNSHILVGESAIFTNISYWDLLRIKDQLDISNLEKIYTELNYLQREKYRVEYNQDKLQLSNPNYKPTFPAIHRPGTVILVPKLAINRASEAISGRNQLVNDELNRRVDDSKIFIGKEIVDIISNPGYRKISVEGSDGSIVKKEMNYPRIFIWCRSLGSLAPDGTRQGLWLDLTKYIESIDTEISSSGGSFTFKLPPLRSKFSEDLDSWVADGDTAFLSPTGSVIVRSSMFSDKLGSRAEYFFKNAISSNDLVFISFDSLIMDGTREFPYSTGDNILSSGSIEPSKFNWDLIGLVDTCIQSTNFDNNSVSITVQGRDLSKLIIDDGSYVFPVLYQSQKNSLLHSEAGLRLYGLPGNPIEHLLMTEYRTIETAVMTIINLISNIRVIPNQVALQAGATSLSNRSSEPTTMTNQYKNYQEAISLAKQLRKAYRPTEKTQDPNIEDIESIKLVDRLIDKLTNTLNQNNNTSYNIKQGDYIKILKISGIELDKTRKSRFIHRGSTIESTQSVDNILSILLKKLHNHITIELKTQSYSKVQSSLDFNGIWGLVKFLFDKDIRTRALADSSLGTPDDSLIGLIENYTQAPWVEFSMDTWGSNFIFLFRKAPWSGSQINNYIDQGLLRNLTIYSEDTIYENLAFDDECYTMYQLEHQSQIWGTELQQVKIPVVIYPELVEIWGLRRLHQTTNMLPISSVVDEKYAISVERQRKRLLDDLKFMIDINIYKPFTRRGTITVHGDKRLRKGLWFLYKPTNEIFYIVSVSNSYNASTLDYETQLVVERGMILDYVTGRFKIKDNSGKDIDLTYFNIADTKKTIDFFKKNVTTIDQSNSIDSEESKIFNINKNVLNFFLSKRQFR